MGWLRSRFGESSTYAGLAAISMVISQLVPADMAAAASATASPVVTLLLGVLAMVKKG